MFEILATVPFHTVVHVTFYADVDLTKITDAVTNIVKIMTAVFVGANLIAGIGVAIYLLFKSMSPDAIDSGVHFLKVLALADGIYVLVVGIYFLTLISGVFGVAVPTG